MAGLPAGAVLDLWERAERLDPLERTLALAAAGAPSADADELARLPLGRRDARLLRLRTDFAGRTLGATAACPACGGRVEFSADADDLLGLETGTAREPVDVDGQAIRWRAPDSSDVAAAATAVDAAGAERILLERCVDSSGPLPETVRAAVAEAMASFDPLAEVLVDVTCPACGASFVADLDIAGFVWAELRARAERLLREVATLARAYGWTEAEALALSDGRRAAYLRLARETGL